MPNSDDTRVEKIQRTRNLLLFLLMEIPDLYFGKLFALRIVHFKIKFGPINTQLKAFLIEI